MKKLKGTGGQTKPFFVRADDMTELWFKLNNKLLWSKEEDVAYFSSLDTMVGDGLGIADSAEYKLDIGQDIWVTPNRWNTLIKQYLDPERLFAWLEGVKDISTYNRGITALDMNEVKRTVVAANARANRRKYGGCMRMLTYRAFPRPTVTLYSRTSYLGYIGALDMLLAHKVIELAADMIGEGLKVSDFQFRWHCEVFQLHGFKSAAFVFASGQDHLLSEPWPTKKYGPLEQYVTWTLMRNWWKRMMKHDANGLKYNEMKYSAEKRIRRRWHAQTGIDQTPFLSGEKAYMPLSTPIELITLDRMLYKTPESRAIIKKQKREKAEKLITSLFEDDDLDGIVDLVEGIV